MTMAACDFYLQLVVPLVTAPPDRNDSGYRRFYAGLADESRHPSDSLTEEELDRLAGYAKRTLREKLPHFTEIPRITLEQGLTVERILDGLPFRFQLEDEDGAEDLVNGIMKGDNMMRFDAKRLSAEEERVCAEEMELERCKQQLQEAAMAQESEKQVCCFLVVCVVVLS